MTGRTSRYQNCTPKRTAFRAGRGLRTAAINTLRWFRATLKHTDQYREATPQPILNALTNHSRPPQMASPNAALIMLSP
jgi:hypothetical protein